MNIVLQAGYALALLSGILVGVDYIIRRRRRKNPAPLLAEQALAAIAMESKFETLQEKLESTRQDLMVKVAELAGLTSTVAGLQDQLKKAEARADKERDRCEVLSNETLQRAAELERELIKLKRAIKDANE